MQEQGQRGKPVDSVPVARERERLRKPVGGSEVGEQESGAVAGAAGAAGDMSGGYRKHEAGGGVYALREVQESTWRDDPDLVLSVGFVLGKPRATAMLRALNTGRTWQERYGILEYLYLRGLLNTKNPSHENLEYFWNEDLRFVTDTLCEQGMVLKAGWGTGLKVEGISARDHSRYYRITGKGKAVLHVCDNFDTRGIDFTGLVDLMPRRVWVVDKL